MATREEALKAELLILTKLGQLESRRTRSIAHAIAKNHARYDNQRTEFLAKHPELSPVLEADGDSDHHDYLDRLKAAAEKQPALPGVDGEEVADAELVTE